MSRMRALQRGSQQCASPLASTAENARHVFQSGAQTLVHSRSKPLDRIPQEREGPRALRARPRRLSCEAEAYCVVCAFVNAPVLERANGSRVLSRPTEPVVVPNPCSGLLLVLLRSSGLPWKSTFALKEAALACLLGNAALGWIGAGTASDSAASRVASWGLHVARPCVPCHRSRADSRCDGLCPLFTLTAGHLLRRRAHGARRHRARRFRGGRHPGGSARRPRPRGEPSMEAEGGEAGKGGGSGGGSRASSNQPWVRPRSPLQSCSSLSRPSPAPDDAAGAVLCCGPAEQIEKHRPSSLGDVAAHKEIISTSAPQSKRCGARNRIGPCRVAQGNRRGAACSCLARSC